MATTTYGSLARGGFGSMQQPGTLGGDRRSNATEPANGLPLPQGCSGTRRRSSLFRASTLFQRQQRRRRPSPPDGAKQRAEAVMPSFPERGDAYCCRRLPTPLTFFVAPAQRRSPPTAAVPDQPLHRHLEYVESGGRSCPSSSHVAGKTGKGEWKLCSVAAVMHCPNTARVSCRRRWRFMLAGDVRVAVASSAGRRRREGESDGRETNEEKQLSPSTPPPPPGPLRYRNRATTKISGELGHGVAVSEQQRETRHERPSFITRPSPFLVDGGRVESSRRGGSGSRRQQRLIKAAAWLDVSPPPCFLVDDGIKQQQWSSGRS
nr:hypothetical protein Iba_chr13dCG6710 [Ipomoea batatas]